MLFKVFFFPAKKFRRQLYDVNVSVSVSDYILHSYREEDNVVEVLLTFTFSRDI